jgi:flavin-binding protein dodecin
MTGVRDLEAGRMLDRGPEHGGAMGSVYKIVELVGTSEESWEDAALTAVNAAGESLRDLRIAEVEKLDLQIADDGSVAAFRTKVKLSFKHEVGG